MFTQNSNGLVTHYCSAIISSTSWKNDVTVICLYAISFAVRSRGVSNSLLTKVLMNVVVLLVSVSQRV